MKIPVCPNCNIRGEAVYAHRNGKSIARGYFCPSCNTFLSGPSIRIQASEIYNGDVRDFLKIYTGQKFDLLLIDPPWGYRDNTIKGYQTMSIDEIAGLPVRNIMEKESVVFLWATNSLLPEAFSVMDSWGFRFVTKIEWVKKRNGKLQKGRAVNVMGSSESILIGKTGNYPVPDWKPPSVMEAPRVKHSEKPELSYLWMEKMYPKARKIEIFARKARKGWYVVGNQIETMHSLNEKTQEVCIEEGK